MEDQKNKKTLTTAPFYMPLKLKKFLTLNSLNFQFLSLWTPSLDFKHEKLDNNIYNYTPYFFKKISNLSLILN
jgi:hypothetical protein